MGRKAFREAGDGYLAHGGNDEAHSSLENRKNESAKIESNPAQCQAAVHGLIEQAGEECALADAGQVVLQLTEEGTNPLNEPET